MHLRSVRLFPKRYPTRKHYPFNLPVFQRTERLFFRAPVTFFVGENGTGKSTLLEALSVACGIHIWGEISATRFEKNPFEGMLSRFIEVEWTDGAVPGSFFASNRARDFARYLEEWAVKDAGVLEYFGGKSLITQSHGQSLMSFFKARYRIKGLYLLDEPETALSPKSQLELLKLLDAMGRAGHAQFIVASHSPILMACPEACLYSFDEVPVREIDYEETEHYRIYKGFMEDRRKYL